MQAAPACSRSVWPQSNQRGIETASPDHQRGASWGPQSNQRGIETHSRTAAVTCRGSSLNRTSVGLKLVPAAILILEGIGPQSNQRGIETKVHAPV